MEQVSFPFKTSLQCVLESKSQLSEFRKLLNILHKEGFHGIELNLPELDFITPRELQALLEAYQLHMDFLATGVYAKKHRLSLSDPVHSDRLRAMEGCKHNIDYAESMNCGIILGFFKGGSGQNTNSSETLFLESMMELKPYIEEKKVLVLIEVTNHRETSVIRTMEEGEHIQEALNSPWIRLLADTYHMNLEEACLLNSLKQYKDSFPHLHISDNNRAFPGLGSLDFVKIYNHLLQIGYQGSVAIEGNIQVSLLDDIGKSSDYLHAACKKILDKNPI